MGIPKFPEDPEERVKFWIDAIARDKMTSIDIRERVVHRMVMSDHFFMDWKVHSIRDLVQKVFRAFEDALWKQTMLKTMEPPKDILED